MSAFTVIGIHSDNDQIFSEHVDADNEAQAFEVAAIEHPLGLFVAVVPGHIHEDNGIVFAGQYTKTADEVLAGE